MTDYTSRFDPLLYLKTYYSGGELSSDDRMLVKLLIDWVRALACPPSTVLDFGCGPVLHTAFALAPFCERIDMADFLDSNLSTIEAWKQNSLVKHDWSAMFRTILQLLGVRTAVEGQARELREKIGHLLHCDLREEPPIQNPIQYDLVQSFYCAECVANDLTEWGEVLVPRILSFVKPEGSAVFSTMKNCQGYLSGSDWFRAVSVKEADWERVLIKNGFDPKTLLIDTVATPEWEQHGFQEVIIARAKRNRSTSVW